MSIVDDLGQIAELRASCEAAFPTAQQEFLLKVLVWSSPRRNRANGIKSLTIKELANDTETPLRVVFAPLDNYHHESASELLDLLDVNEIPSGFVTERANSVP